MNGDTLIITGIGAAMTLAAMVPFLRRQNRRERETVEREALALQYGLHEPVTLHPVVDPERCIGTGSCVEVCPEDVIGFRSGVAVAVSPACCIGHGLCERACPMEAIRLVFGSERRGVDLPRIRENFETNVPGLYIVGELGGMGLIRNAFEQGRQCIEGIVRERRPAAPDELDAVIVGCGPAGLSASLHALHHGLRTITLEKEGDVGGTVRSYPRKKLVMTESVRVPGYGKLSFREVRKEELIEVWDDIIARTGLEVMTGATVTAVRPHEAGGFTVTSTGGEYRAARVILAIGRRGVPRKLGVPGEDSPHIAYSLREPEAYRDDRILVVGGGDSAVEAALALAEQPGNRVRISYRGEQFSRIKEGNRQRIGDAVEGGRVETLWSTQVKEIRPGAVRLAGPDGEVRSLDADAVFVFIGGELPTRFLADCGVAIDTKFGAP